MSNEGLKNDVVLCGNIRSTESRTLDADRLMFKAKINDIKIIAWGTIAERMSSEIREGDVVRISGIIKERSYDSACKKCGGKQKTYWTDVEVYAFTKEEN